MAEGQGIDKRMKPKVSVIIPVFNAEKYLSPCLDSVIHQSLWEIEVICVDDCSTDASAQLLADYAARDARVQIIKNESNLHAGPSRNRGLQRAKGEYVLFLDADDWLMDNSLEQLYLETVRRGADISRCRALEYDNTTGAISRNEFSYLKNVPDFLFNRVIRYSKFPRTLTKVNVAPWGGLYRREFLLQNSLTFDSLICSNDRPFYCKTILAAKRVVFLKTELIYYRVNNEYSLVGNRAKNFTCHFDSYEIISTATAGLPARLRRIYLTGELFDMAHWLEKSLQTEYAEEVKKEMENFLSQLDASPWGGRITGERWYKRVNSNRKKHYEENLRDE